MSRRHAVHDQQVDQLEIRSVSHHDVHVLELVGELDIHSAPAFDGEIKRIERSDARTIIVDLSGLKFISAEGLKVVIHANARSREHDHRLRLLAGTDHVKQTFETAGLVSRLPFDEARTLEFLSHHQPPQTRLVMPSPVRNCLASNQALSPWSASPPAYRRWRLTFGRRHRARSRPHRG